MLTASIIERPGRQKNNEHHQEQDAAAVTD